ncbi:TolC family protein, partial [Pseudomonas aeruginosa]|nr:TolC family protein [Pseudomonas aeruginosa]EIU3968376.1 TolC family protein [Pseudomonas aeruginosa]EKU8382856.1 TolC family protein [Pseudomonas aeruginosa]EKU8393730.1 TolC family protein [Pseudomonas aeruginosa]
ANAELAALEARRDAERFERHQALFDKYQELTHARHELGSLRERMLPMAESALATTRRGFEQGRFSYLSLAQAQRTLFDLRSRAVEAAARYHLLLVEVERLTATVEENAP